MGEAKLKRANGKASPAKDQAVARAAVQAAEDASEANVGTLDQVNAMIAELTEQNNILRGRAVNYAGQLAKANAIIAKRDALIEKLRATKFGEKGKRDAGEAASRAS